MKAFKCDRCGEYYSKSTENYKYQVGEYDEKHKLYMYDDLCDGCLAELGNWMENKSNKEGECNNCIYWDLSEAVEPCRWCKNAHTSKFEPKEAKDGD